MYGLDGSYATATAFVLGCDAGNGWGLLNGFEEWLMPQVDGEPNVAWPSLVVQASFPDGRPEPPWTREDEDRAVGALYRLLDEFLAARGEGGPIERRSIYERYFEWEQRRPPYEFDLQPPPR
jgi:hypothetical protein